MNEQYREYSLWHSCQRKKTYDTRDKAKQAAKRLNRLFKTRKKVYRCRHCDKFHLGEWKFKEESEWRKQREQDQTQP